MQSLGNVQRDFLQSLLQDRTPQGGDWLQGDVQRLDIYRNNYRCNLENALRAGYPVTVQLVGDEFFSFLAQSYRHEHPSRSANLDEYGHDLADFIAHFQPAASLPYLADVARLERLLEELLVAPDGPALNLDALVRMAESGDLSPLRLNPAAALLHSQFPLSRIWQAHQPDAKEDAIDLGLGEEYLLLRRAAASLLIEPVSAAEFHLLHAFQQGYPVSMDDSDEAQVQQNAHTIACRIQDQTLCIVVADDIANH